MQKSKGFLGWKCWFYIRWRGGTFIHLKSFNGKCPYVIEKDRKSGSHSGPLVLCGAFALDRDLIISALNSQRCTFKIVLLSEI